MAGLFYRQLGSGPALIILHGLFGMSDNWLSFARSLESEFSIFLPDQRNHGQSFHSEQMDYPTLSNDIAEFIRQKGLAPVNIIGHSMGGKVIMHLAADYPSLIRRMMIVDISPRKLSNPQFQRFIRGLEEINLAEINTRSAAEARLTGTVPNPAIRQFLLKNLYRSENGQFRWRINLPVLAQNIERITAEFNPAQPVQTGTLFVRGGNSNHINPEDIAYIKSIFSQVSFVTIENASHWVHADQPAGLIHITKEYFKK